MKQNNIFKYYFKSLAMAFDPFRTPPLKKIIIIQVRGGPKDALIVYATQSTHSSLLYQEAFLITFRTFISSLELVNKLIKRLVVEL